MTVLKLGSTIQRAEIARRVCAALDWVDVQGRPKLMSARVGLLRLHRAGLIALPPPRGGNGNGLPLRTHGLALPERPSESLRGSVGELAGLHLEAVAEKSASRLWNGLIARWHYLGYQPLPGAQLRYLIRCEAAARRRFRARVTSPACRRWELWVIAWSGGRTGRRTPASCSRGSRRSPGCL